MSVIYTLKIITHSMNVRTGPSTNNKIIDWVQKNDIYTASKTQNGWYYIDSLGGWVSGNSRYVSVSSKSTTPPAPKPPPTSSTSSNGNTTSTTTGNKGSTTETKKPPKSYVVDLSRSAGDRIDNFKSSISSSTGGYRDNFTNISVHDRNPRGNLPIPVYSTGGYNDPENRFKIPESGLVNFAEYTKGRSLSHDKTSIEGMTTALNIARSEMNIFDTSDPAKLFKNFNRYKVGMPGAELHKAFPYIFFTRPEIDVLDPSTGKLRPEIDAVNHTFTYLHNDNPEILRSINASYKLDHQFNIFLSNMARSFDPADEVIRTIETGDTYTGWKTVYGRNTNESNSAGQFNIQYRDNRNLDVLKIHKAWVDYMNAVYRGAIEVSREYIHKKILNYACAVYFIVCAEDGETILSWTKYYGVFPINSPMSALGWSHGQPIKLPEFTISYMYAMKDDMDPVTLAEFNQLSSGELRYKTVYNPNRITTNNTWHGAPYIDVVKQPNGLYKYKLRFRF